MPILLPRSRFTIRCMMVAAAVVALLIGLERLFRRSTRYRRIADHYAKAEITYREFQTIYQRRTLWHTEQAHRKVEGWGFDDDRHRASVEAQTPDGVEAGYCRQEAAAWAVKADWSSQLRRQRR